MALQVALEKAQDASRHSHGHASTTSTFSFEEICIKLIEAGSETTAADEVFVTFHPLTNILSTFHRLFNF